MTRSLAILFCLCAATALGHARLKSPAPRDNKDGYKDPPGPGTGAPLRHRAAASQPTRRDPRRSDDRHLGGDGPPPRLLRGRLLGGQRRNFESGRSRTWTPPRANPPHAHLVGGRHGANHALRGVHAAGAAADVEQRCAGNSLATNCPPATIPAGATYYSCANIVIGRRGPAARAEGRAAAAAVAVGDAAAARPGVAVSRRAGHGGQAGTSGQPASTTAGPAPPVRPATTGKPAPRARPAACGRGSGGHGGPAGTTGQAGDSGQAGNGAPARPPAATGQAGASSAGGEA